MAKFKVGDKVRVLPHNWVSFDMEKQIGKIGTITFDDGSGHMQYRLDIGQARAPWHENCFELAQPRREFIVIRRSGAETIAELRHDREVIKSAKATCAPSDTFDLDTGAKLAFDRLMGREEPRPAPKPDPYAKYFTHSKDFESRSKFKIGDLVIRDGETKTVVGHERDSGNWVWTLDNRDSRPYPNLEHFLSPVPTPEPPKFYTGKVVMTACEYSDRKSHIGRLFEFKDGKYVGSEVREFRFFGEPYASFDEIVKAHTASAWLEVKE